MSVQGWERGWLVLPQQKATGEGQTGEAGTETRSPPRVNSARSCSLFKALNRGWYLSSPEFGARGLLALV